MIEKTPFLYLYQFCLPIFVHAFVNTKDLPSAPVRNVCGVNNVANNSVRIPYIEYREIR